MAYAAAAPVAYTVANALACGALYAALEQRAVLRAVRCSTAWQRMVRRDGAERGLRDT